MPKVTLTTLTLLLSCLFANSTVAEVYRFPPLTVFVFSAERALDESNGQAVVGIQNYLDRLPSELSIVFESEPSVLFPTTITAILAVKPMYGQVEARLLIPLQHRGEGRYQLGGTSSDLDEARSWFVKHIDDFGKGNIVLEQFDGLHASLSELNGRVVNTKLKALYGEKDVSGLINPDYSHLTAAHFDSFPYERGWRMAPEVYQRVPVEVLGAVRKETFDAFPAFVQQRVNAYRLTGNGRGSMRNTER